MSKKREKNKIPGIKPPMEAPRAGNYGENLSEMP